MKIEMNPEMNKLRIVVVRSQEMLALDFAKQKGTPVAVIGVNAVPCKICDKAEGIPCTDPTGLAARYPHLQRLSLMSSELERLQKEAANNEK